MDHLSTFADGAPWFVGWGTLALINAALAQGKNRSGLLWFLLSLLLGIGLEGQELHSEFERFVSISQINGITCLWVRDGSPTSASAIEDHIMQLRGCQ